MYMMKTVFFLVIVTILAACVQAGWWRRTSKSAGVEVSQGPNGPTVKGKLTISWRKRRAAEKHGKYSVVLLLNPCDFKSYDEDRTGSIEFAEIKDIFEDTTISHLFFNEADSNEDGSISEEEFAAFSKNISGCEK